MGLQHRVPYVASSVTGTNGPISKHLQQRPYRGTDQHASRKRSTGRSPASLRARLLQSSLCSAQARREVETHHRSESPKRLCSHSKIQDGIVTNNLVCSVSREFHRVNRSYGRVFPRSHSSKFKKVPQNPVRKSGLSVQGSPLRFKYRSLDFYKGYGRSESHCSPTRGGTLPLFGRLALSDTVLLPGSEGVRIPGKSLLRLGTHGQFQEVRTHPFAGLCFYRSSLQSSPKQGLSQGGECPKAATETEKVSEISVSNSKRVSVTARIHEQSTSVHKVCQTSHEASSVAPAKQLAGCIPESLCEDTSHSSHKDLSSVVDKSVSRPSGGSSSGPRVQDSDFHGCVLAGLGCTCRRCPPARTLVRGRVKTAYQCLGNESSLPGIEKVQSSSGTIHSDLFGQYNSGCPREQAGRHPLVGVDEGNDVLVSASYSKGLDSEGQVHSGAPECSGRPAVKSRPDPPVRVVSSSGNSRLAVSDVELTSDRPLCNKKKQKDSYLCISSTRLPSSRGGCSVNELSGSRRLRISSSSNPAKGVTEVSRHNSVQADSRRPVVAKTAMVPCDQQSSSLLSSSAATVEAYAQTAFVRRVPRRSRISKSTRLVLSQESLKAQGFSDRVIPRILAPQADSTKRVYDYKWLIWEEWCWAREREPDRPSIPLIADFLDYLFVIVELAVSTIRGYRSALSSALKFSSDLDVGGSLYLNNMIVDFLHKRPPRSSVVPRWDLTLVLWTLMEPPFEPLAGSSACALKFLTWKTAFLLLLASGVRRGELHAIKFKGVFYPQTEVWDHVTLKPDPKFLTKTRVITGQALKPIRIESIDSVLSEDLRCERALCPVRATKAYLARTEKMRKGKDLFLISYAPSKQQDIHVNTLSSWIAQLIEFCYKMPGRQAIKLSGKNVHEVRAYAASLVHKGVWSMEDVLESGSWKKPSTFISHYLKDLTEQNLDWSSIGPIIAGRKLVNQ